MLLLKVNVLKLLQLVQSSYYRGIMFSLYVAYWFLSPGFCKKAVISKRNDPYIEHNKLQEY